MTTSNQLHLSQEDKNWQNEQLATYQTLKQKDEVAAKAWLKEVLQSDMHKEIDNRKKIVNSNRQPLLEEIRTFDTEEQDLLEAQKALNSKRPSIDDLRKQLNISEQQEKLDAEILRSNAVREWMYSQFPKDKQAFDLLTEKLINNPQRMKDIIDTTWQVAKHFPEIDLTIKNLDMRSLLEDEAFVQKFIVIYKAKELLRSLAWTPAWEKEIICVRRKVFGYKNDNGTVFPIDPKMKALLDSESQAWNEANVENTRKLRQYIADILWVPYDPTNFSEDSIIYRAEMFIRAMLWWNFENCSYEWQGMLWIPWDLYFNIAWKHIDIFQITGMSHYYQVLSYSRRDDIDACLALSAWWWLSRA